MERVWENARRKAEVRWFDDGGKGRASAGARKRYREVEEGEGCKRVEYRTLNWRE